MTKSCSIMMESPPLQSSGRIFAMSILAGLLAGGILAVSNMAMVQPYTDMLAEFYLDELIVTGEFDEEEFDLQMESLRESQQAGAVAMGVGAGALVGGAYVFGGGRGKSPLKAAILIAGVAWFVLYAMPALKYPPVPQPVFDQEIAGQYYPLVAGYAAVSGLAALGILAGFRKVKRKNKELGAAALYLVVISIAFFVFPDHPAESYFPQPIINAWRSAIAASMAALWFSAGIISGLLWTFGKSKKAA